MMEKNVSSAVIRYSSELNMLATYLSCLKKISIYSNGYWERHVKDFTLWLWIDWFIYFPMEFCHFFAYDFETVFRCIQI